MENGFIANRSTSGQILTIRIIIEDANAQNQQLLYIVPFHRFL